MWALHTFTLCLLMVEGMPPAPSHLATLISWWDKMYSWSISKKKYFLLTWYLSTYFITQNKKRVKAWTKRKLKSAFLFLYEGSIKKYCQINYFITYDILHYCALLIIVLNFLSRWFNLLWLFLILTGRKY